MAQDILILHKWRRAPYGGGKFWSAAKDALKTVLEHGEANHDLLQTFAASVANDHGQSLSAGLDFGEVRRLMYKMVEAPWVAKSPCAGG